MAGLRYVSPCRGLGDASGDTTPLLSYIAFSSFCEGKAIQFYAAGGLGGRLLPAILRTARFARCPRIADRDAVEPLRYASPHRGLSEVSGDATPPRAEGSHPR